MKLDNLTRSNIWTISESELNQMLIEKYAAVVSAGADVSGTDVTGVLLPFVQDAAETIIASTAMIEVIFFMLFLRVDRI